MEKFAWNFFNWDKSDDELLVRSFWKNQTCRIWKERLIINGGYIQTITLIHFLLPENQKIFNIVLVYKSEGPKTLIGPKMYGHVILKNDAFAFEFQTEEIKHVWKIHKVVLIDSTHKNQSW